MFLRCVFIIHQCFVFKLKLLQQQLPADYFEEIKNYPSCQIVAVISLSKSIHL